MVIEKGTDVICLQEADILFEEPLNKFLMEFPDWSVKYIHESRGANLAILWNTKKLKFKNMETMLLPKPKDSCCQRVAQLTVFNDHGKEVRISNVHLSWEGGISHRFKQLHYLKDELNKNKIDHEVICGDFNTFAPAFLRNIQKRKAQEILGEEWKNAFPDLVWSCDVSHSYPPDNFHIISTLFKKLGFRLRSCLDYVFVKNIRVVKGEMLDLSGSDHRPIIINLDLN